MRLLQHDLRGMIEALESTGRVHRVKRQVASRFELAAVIHRIQATSNLPVVFERVEGTTFPVVSNLFGNYEIFADMLGTEPSGLLDAWNRATSLEVAAAPPPGKSAAPPEMEEIRLGDVPQIVFCEKDAGPYITAGVVLARDPDSGVVNLSYHRMQFAGPDRLRLRLSRSGDLYRLQRAAEEAGRAFPVAVMIGGPPAVIMSGAASIPAGSSEIDMAARLAGRRFASRPCETVDLSVPAEAEFVIEGEILPDVREPEGPFGEWMGTYVPVTDNHVLAVRRVAARRSALFHAILSGSKEELTLSGLPNAALIYKAVRAFDQNVLDVSCLPWMQICAIKMRKTYEGQPQKAMLGAMGAETNRMLYCVVVDEDVDVHDIQDVLWAMSTRCRVDRDIFQIPGVPSFARDPHQQHWGRIGIDATAPLACREDFERKRIPGLEAVRLEDYL